MSSREKRKVSARLHNERRQKAIEERKLSIENQASETNRKAKIAPIIGAVTSASVVID